MRARVSLSALALAIVATLAVAAPAAAAPVVNADITVGGTTWSINSFEAGETPYIDVAVATGWQGGEETYDDGLSPVYLAPDATGLGDYSDLECSADGNRTTATDGTGDEIVTCALSSFDSGNGTLAGLWEQRFFSDGVTVRSRLIVTNNSASTVADATVGIYENYYQDDDTRVGASTSAGHPAPADTTTADGDLLWVIYDALDANDYESPVILTAAGTGDATVTPVMGDAAGDGSDTQATMYALPDLAAGDSVEIVQFTVWNFFAFDLAPSPSPTPTPTFSPEAESASTEASTTTPADASQERATVEVVTDEGFTKTAFLEPAALYAPSALAAVTESWADRSRFDTLSVRDAAGIADTGAVLNWVAEPRLAATGPSDLLPLTALAGLLLLAGAGAGVVVARRRAA